MNKSNRFVTDVEEPSRPLVVGGTFWEVGFCDELVCLVEQVVEEVVAQQKVQESGLTFEVRTQRARTQATVQKSKSNNIPNIKNIKCSCYKKCNVIFLFQLR